MMANVVMQCSVCGQQNVAPRLHSNMLMKEGANTFCSRCNKVTSQRITGATNPTPSAAREQSPQPVYPYDTNTQAGSTQPAATSGGNYGGAAPATSGPPGVGISGGTATLAPHETQLWTTFENRLKENSLSLDDVYRCDADTQKRLFGSLQFDAAEQNQLVDLVAKMSPYKKTTATPPPQQQHQQLHQQSNQNFGGLNNTPAFNSLANHSQPNAAGGLGTAGQQFHGGANFNNINQHQHPNPADRFDGNSSPIKGLEISGDTIIARCSVYPNQPAEFWCASCNVLVSSRCHVQGIHKDHPFISLRLAAEAHVRDLGSWSERCRNQLNVTSSVISNLKHSETTLQQEAQKQYDQLDQYTNQIQQDLMRWKEQLKQDIHNQMQSQQTSIHHSIEQSEQLHALYQTQLAKCEPLINNVPPAEVRDPTQPPPAEVRQDGWALRVLDLVSKLKIINSEPIPMPRVTVPQVVCQSTPSTHMELLKCSYVPLGVRLPDMLDPAFFNFPHAGGARRIPFTLEGGDDALAKGVLIHNGRTLTRTQDVVPAHVLVSASQVFFSGVTTWDIHVDRIGSGPGRILIGIILHGTDGEGVVWDGHRIVGPNEGECRTIDERFAIQPGTVLRMHLELEAPTCFLHCFINRDGVAKIPLPATGQGWCPAFSVFGPQDQITVTPTSSTQLPAAQLAAEQSAAATPGRAVSTASQGVTSPDTQRNTHLIGSLQQQIQVLSERLNQEQNMRMMQHQQGGGGGSSPAINTVNIPLRGNDSSAGNYSPPQQHGGPPRQQQQQQVGQNALPPVAPSNFNRQAAPEAYTGGGIGGGARGASSASNNSYKGPTTTTEAYSPELRQLMRYVNDVPH